MKPTEKTKLLVILSVLLIIAISHMALFYCRLSKERRLNQQDSELISRIISENEKETNRLSYVIDSLELEYSRLYIGHQSLKIKYTDLEKKKQKVKIDYYEKKPEQRAVDFLSMTQDIPPGIPVFVNDSLLVPMDNVDIAMSLIFDGQFADSVILVKDEEIEILNEQLMIQSRIIETQELRFVNQSQTVSLLETRVDLLVSENNSLSKKNKFQKIVSRVKDGIIIAGLTYIILKQ